MEKVIIPKVVTYTKKHLEERYNLVKDKEKIRNELYSLLQNTDAHHYKTERMIVGNCTKGDLKKAREEDLKYVKYAHSLSVRLAKIEDAILDIDRAIVLKLETFFGDFVAEVNLKERQNLAGDMIEEQSFYYVPEITNKDYCEVTVGDLYTLRALKSILNPHDIKFLSKKSYKE